jgi:flagellar hook-associated protein 2
MSTLGEENQMASVSATSTPTIGVGSDGKVTAGNLVANLDTKAIVDALMTAASIPKVQLEGRIKVEQTRVSMYQSLNTGLQTLQTTTDGYTAANAMNLLSVKSSDSSITATTTTSAAATELSMQVDSVAKKQVSVTAAAVAFTGTKFTLVDSSGKQTEVTAASTKPSDVAKAINSAGAGITASAVASGTDANGNTLYRLQLTSATTGANASFSAYEGSKAEVSAGAASNLLTATGAATVSAASDAKVTLWPGTAAAQSVTSATNQFTDLTPGVTVSVSAVTTAPSTLTITRDDASISNTVSNVVSAVAQIQQFITKQQAGSTSTADDGSTTYTAGNFTGDSMTRTLSKQLQSAVTAPIDGKSLSQYGISITADGTVAFDSTKFKTALAADPEATTKAMQTVYQRVSDAVSSASDPAKGYITQSVKTQQTRIETDQTADTAWTTRLAAQRELLVNRYTALATTLSQMQAQQDYLTQQIDAMNKPN